MADVSSSLAGVGNGTIMLILLIGIVLVFCFILYKSIDNRFRKIKVMVFEGGNSFAICNRRLKADMGIVPDDIIGILMNKPYVPESIQKWEQQEQKVDEIMLGADKQPILDENGKPMVRTKVYVGHGYIYDTKGNKIFLAKKLTDGTLVPIFVYTEDKFNEIRLENYKRAGHIASEYLDLQDRIRKTAEASNPIMAILLPAIPSLLMFAIMFIGMYMIIQTIMSSYTEISGDMVKISQQLNDIGGKLAGSSTSQGINPATNGIVISPPSSNPLGSNHTFDITSGLPANAQK